MSLAKAAVGAVAVCAAVGGGALAGPLLLPAALSFKAATVIGSIVGLGYGAAANRVITSGGRDAEKMIEMAERLERMENRQIEIDNSLRTLCEIVAMDKNLAYKIRKLKAMQAKLEKVIDSGIKEVQDKLDEIGASWNEDDEQKLNNSNGSNVRNRNLSENTQRSELMKEY